MVGEWVVGVVVESLSIPLTLLKIEYWRSGVINVICSDSVGLLLDWVSSIDVACCMWFKELPDGLRQDPAAVGLNQSRDGRSVATMERKSSTGEIHVLLLVVVVVGGHNYHITY